MLKLLVIGIGGFIGAVARYGLSGLVHRHFNSSFPSGTLAVNVLGCLLIGLFMFMVENGQFFSPSTRLFLVIGMLGSFTTFSTVGYETFEFLKTGELPLALLNIALNVVLGVAAVMAGWVAAKAIGFGRLA